MKGSWGVDVEDKLIDEYIVENENIDIKVQIYEIEESKSKRCAAQYTYNGVDYFLVGEMKPDEFEFLIKNLNIF